MKVQNYQRWMSCKIWLTGIALNFHTVDLWENYPFQCRHGYWEIFLVSMYLCTYLGIWWLLYFVQADAKNGENPSFCSHLSVHKVSEYLFSKDCLVSKHCTKVDLTPITMLQKLTKCEVKAWLCWKLIILLTLRFYVTSNFGKFKQSKNVLLAIWDTLNFEIW